jgi:hypothetical protein
VKIQGGYNGFKNLTLVENFMSKFVEECFSIQLLGWFSRYLKQNGDESPYNPLKRVF